MNHTKAVWAALLTAGIMAGCAGTSARSRAPSSAVPAPQSSAGVTDTLFTNSVPEAPWWQAAPPARGDPTQPVSLQWNLSGDVLFDTGSATLSLAADSQLTGVVAQALLHPGARIVIRGYTDNTPDPAFPDGNQGLSEARAEAVASYLRSVGVGGDQITAAGYAFADPVADNATDAGRQQNRRVAITLTAP